jgi:thymidylate synthase
LITGPSFETFQPAYVAVLRHVMSSPDFATATRGKTAQESINVSFTIRRPIARTAYLAARGANIVFNHAEALWYLSGRDDLDMIAYYAPTLRQLSVDGKRLTGTAYGPRLFGHEPEDGLSQFDRVLRLLRDDPDAKRAAMMIMHPDELADPTNPDVACTLGLQLMLRGGALHMAAFMRGNDAVIGLLGDTFAFTFIQEFAARLLAVRVGTYAHHVGSMHINVRDLDKVKAILAESESGGTNFAPAEMPAGTSWSDIHQVLEWEQRLRHNEWHVNQAMLDQLPAKRYWRRVVMLFEVYRQIIHEPGKPVTGEALDALHSGHRWLVEQRWPRRMPSAARAGAAS